jgi:hypothetical protein
MQIVAKCQIALGKVFFYVLKKCSPSVKYSTLETIVKCQWFAPGEAASAMYLFPEKATRVQH